MKTLLLSLAAVAALGASMTGYAQVPAGAPAGSTGLCKDGTYYAGPTKKGACAGHKGVKDWYGAMAPAAAAGAAAAPAAPAPGTAPSPAAAAVANTPATKAVPMPAPGAPGQVWANNTSKVYHCPTDRYYGKTKDGAYMSEAEAKAKGFKADHGKACS